MRFEQAIITQATEKGGEIEKGQEKKELREFGLFLIEKAVKGMVRGIEEMNEIIQSFSKREKFTKEDLETLKEKVRENITLVFEKIRKEQEQQLRGLRDVLRKYKEMKKQGKEKDITSTEEFLRLPPELQKIIIDKNGKLNLEQIKEGVETILLVQKWTLELEKMTTALSEIFILIFGLTQSVETLQKTSEEMTRGANKSKEQDEDKGMPHKGKKEGE